MASEKQEAIIAKIPLSTSFKCSGRVCLRHTLYFEKILNVQHVTKTVFLYLQNTELSLYLQQHQWQLIPWESHEWGFSFCFFSLFTLSIRILRLFSSPLYAGDFQRSNGRQIDYQMSIALRDSSTVCTTL